MEAILLNKEQLVSKNGKEYTRASLGTGSEVITVYCWDGTLKDLDIYSCLSFRQDINNGFYSASNVVKINDVSGLEKYKPRIITKEYLSGLQQTILSRFKFDDNEKKCIMDLLTKVYELYKDRYAATKYHHNYSGGLLTHSIELVEIYLKIYNLPMFSGADPFVVIVSCLLHDYGKINEYDKDGNITESFFLFGHIYLSARYAEDICTNASIPLCKKANIIHCILSHHGRVEYGSPVVPSTKEAFLVSKLDELSGFGYQFNIEGNEMTYNGSRNKVINLKDKEL